MSFTKTTIAVLTQQNYQNLLVDSLIQSMFVVKRAAMLALGQTDDVLRLHEGETTVTFERDWLDLAAAEEWKTFVVEQMTAHGYQIESYIIVDKTA